MSSHSIRRDWNDCPARNDSPHRPSWQLGYLTDHLGHVHLGALIPGGASEPPVYLDLLSSVGSASLANLNLERLTVIVEGKDLAELRRIVERSVTDARLKDRLLELIARSSGSI